MSVENHRMPADEGLSGLGLVMQLAGGLFAVMTAFYGLSFLIELADAGDVGMSKFWVFLIACAGVARSMLHRSAGLELLYGGAPLAAVRRYVWFGLGHTFLWLIWLRFSLEVPWKAASPLIFMFAAWPVTLLVLMSRPRFKAIDGPVPPPRDGGYEGAGGLMMVLGVCGLLYTAVMGLALFGIEGGSSDTIWKLMLGVTIVLLIRSAMHVRAAARTLGNRNLDSTMESTIAYGNFGALSAMIAGAAFLIVAIKAQAGMGMTLVTIGSLIGMLLVWPLAIRRFVQERRFIEGGDVNNKYQISSDRGLTALGWLLLAMGVMSIATALPAALWPEATNLGGIGPLMRSAMTFGPAAVEGRSLWWPVVLAGLQIWAGLELVGMTPRYKAAAFVYGALGSALTLYLEWPILKELGELGNLAGSDNLAVLGVVALTIAVPAATLALATRELPGADPRTLGKVFG